MNNKNILKKTAAIALGVALTIGATGCNFVLTDNEKDLAQTVAKVDITKTLAKDKDYEAVSADISSILKSLPSEISKRELVAYFLSYGYQYVQNYGYSYKDAFNLLMNELVSREVMIQYAVAHYLKEGAADGITAENCQKYATEALAALQTEIDKLTDGTEEKANKQTEKKLLEAHPEVLTLKYFLTNGGTSNEDYNYTVYSLRKSFNDSLDSLEQNYVKVEEEVHDHATAQTLPNGVETQKEKYYPVDGEGNLNYNVYTGRNLRSNCGEYESIDGSTTATRQRAYNDFLANLQSYNLVQSNTGKVEKTKEATLLDYYYVELSSSLGQALINKYFEDLEDEVLEKLNEEYAERKYAEDLASQELKYAKDSDAFTTALDSESASSITLYGLENFGFVYNILLPFSSSQNEVYSRAQNSGLTTDELYNVRKSLLTQIVGKDQRAGWINEHEDESYATEKDGKYYFFQNIIGGKSEYEDLEHYLGLVPFNGTAELKDDKYEYTFNDVTVDSVVDDFLSLVQSVVPTATVNETEQKYVDYATNYEKDSMTTKYVKEDGEVDYSKFVYRAGKIDIGEVNPYDYFNKESNVYKMISVANELMFAYSTDPGCLNSYFGYAISPISTNFMKEFEYAGQQAVKDGVGAYYVAPTDYGWHIIITTFAFKGGEVYGGYNHADAVGDAMVEGSFSQLYYEYLKSKEITSYTNEIQTKVLNDYNTDDSVKLFKDNYKDLLEM